MTMKSFVSHGYGCGGHCAFNWHGQSTVMLTFGAGGQAQVSDQGTADFSQASSGGYSNTKRTWGFLWVGTWAGNDARRTVDAQRLTSSCDVSVDARNQDTKQTCPTAPQDLQLVCEWGEIPRGRERPAANAAPTSGAAWVCRTEPSLDGYPGTELPWVFSPVTQERRTVGEPEPETTFVPWHEPSPNAAP